jgi:hypothetical protein
MSHIQQRNDHEHNPHNHGPDSEYRDQHDHDHGRSAWARAWHVVSEVIGGHSHHAADQI